MSMTYNERALLIELTRIVAQHLMKDPDTHAAEINLLNERAHDVRKDAEFESAGLLRCIGCRAQYTAPHRLGCENARSDYDAVKREHCVR